MAYLIALSSGVVEVIHSGPVAYGDRLAALDAVAADGRVGEDTPILINFTDARLVAESVHADYIARAVTHPFFRSRRVAMIGLSTDEGRTAWTAAAIRRIQFRLFSEREEAIDWLTLAEA